MNETALLRTQLASERRHLWEVATPGAAAARAVPCAAAGSG
jgi:hypothetical protein